AELTIVELPENESARDLCITSTVLTERPPPDPELERMADEVIGKLGALGIGHRAFTIGLPTYPLMHSGPIVEAIREYYYNPNLLRPVSFKLTNTGPVALTDLRLMARIDNTAAALVTEDPPARPLGQFGVESFKFAGQIRGTNWASVTEE